MRETKQRGIDLKGIGIIALVELDRFGVGELRFIRVEHFSLVIGLVMQVPVITL